MGRLGRDIYRSRLNKLLSQCSDEPMIRLIATVSAALDGKAGARRAVPDLPEEAVGAQVGSRYHIAPWILETLANELLSAPKQSPMTSGRYRELRTDRFAVLDMLARLVIALENAEDGMFLAKHDVFTEMHRLVQRQFPWQRGSSAPALYRSLMLYGTGNAASYFERETGLKTSDFVKVGAWLASALSRRDGVRRETDLYSAAISPDVRDRALRRLVIGHEDARGLTRRMRAPNLHTAYKPSILRDFPIIAFGDQQERLRAPLPALITRRFTDGHYLDVVGGGAAVWTEIGKRFEQYCVEYLAQMLAPYDVCGER